MSPTRPLWVWAPRAGTVEVLVGSERRPMTATSGGHHELPGGIGAGAPYLLSLDGGDPLPDPRSHHQPNGVHGPSTRLDHDAFAWTDAGRAAPPLRDAVIYELHVGTFTRKGTFEAAIERLDHLVDLGIGYVELMPVAEFPGDRGWGYDGVDLFAPKDSYGGPRGLKHLVDACHARGLGVIVDVVYNHLGPSGNHLDRFGPYFTDRYSTPWGRAVNFDDAGSDEVRAFFIDNALMWLRDYHFDALRLDAVHAIFDRSAVHLLEELAVRVAELEAELGRPLYVIAESDLNDPRLVREREAGGFGLHAQWSDDFHHALHAVLTGERNGYYADFGEIAHVAKALERAYVYDGIYSRFRGRRHGRPTTGLTGERFLAYMQNHDQIGNRAVGERSAALMPTGRLKIAAALVLTSPFVPMLFQGEEWAASTPFLYFTDHDDPELGRAVTEGRRKEFAAFGWDPAGIPDPQDPGSFERSVLDWSEMATAPHSEMLAWHRDLIGLRAATPDLRDHDLDAVATEFDEDARRLIVLRGSITIACNLAAEARRLPVPGPRRGRLLLAARDPVAVSDSEVEMGPESVCIWAAS